MDRNLLWRSDLHVLEYVLLEDFDCDGFHLSMLFHLLVSSASSFGAFLNAGNLPLLRRTLDGDDVGNDLAYVRDVDEVKCQRWGSNW